MEDFREMLMALKQRMDAFDEWKNGFEASVSKTIRDHVKDALSDFIHEINIKMERVEDFITGTNETIRIIKKQQEAQLEKQETGIEKQDEIIGMLGAMVPVARFGLKFGGSVFKELRGYAVILIALWVWNHFNHQDIQEVAKKVDQVQLTGNQNNEILKGDKK